MNKLGLTLMVSAAALAGCATIRAHNCTENAGYQKGYNDALSGAAMDMGSYSFICGKEAAAVPEKAYKDGYAAGQKKAAEQGPQVDLTLKGGKIGVVGAWQCEVTYKHKTFRADADTESRARMDALSKCQAKYSSCSSADVSCTR